MSKPTQNLLPNNLQKISKFQWAHQKTDINLVDRCENAINCQDRYTKNGINFQKG